MSERIEFGSRQAANAAREEFAEYICPVDDDRRLRTVTFVSDAPGWEMEQAEQKAYEGQIERSDGPGQENGKEAAIHLFSN